MTAPQGPSTAFLDFVKSRQLPLSSLASRGPANSDIAKYILVQAQKKNMGPGHLAAPKSDSGPSLMGRVFDVLSRPNYAIANFVDAIIDDDPNTEALSEAWEGLAGRDKTTFSDVLETAGMEEGPGRAALGLGLDIFADPLTYVGGAGVVKALGKAGKGGNKAVRLPPKGEPAVPESFGLPTGPPVPAALAGHPKPTAKMPTGPVGVDIPFAGKANIAFKSGEQLQLPGLAVPSTKATKPGVAGREAPPVGPKVAEAKGQYALNFGKGFGINKLKKELSTKAPEVVEGVAQGSAASVFKIAPKPLPTPKMGDGAIQANADEILSSFDPGKATAKLNKVAPDSINAKQQRFLWEAARKSVQAKTMRKGRSGASIEAEIFANTAAVYKRMEDALIQGGKVPRIGSGENVKLSDVVAELTVKGIPVDNKILSEFASEIKPGSTLNEVVQGLRAKGAIDEAASVKLITDKALESKTLIETSKGFSDNQLKGFENFVKSFARKAAKTGGLSPAAAHTAGSVLASAIRAGKSPAQVAVEGKRAILDDIIATGKNNPKVQQSTTLALEKDLGKIPKWAHNDNKAVESVMARIATWWGQKELRPMTLNAMGSGYSMTKARGMVLDKMFEGADITARADAFKAAQGLGGAPSELSTQITRFMDNIVGHTMGQSILFRSGVTMDRLNSWVKRQRVGHEFTKKSINHPLTGEAVDLSKGTDWAQSWKYWDLGKQDPKQFLFNLQEAMSHATAERAFFDDLAARFGSITPSKGYRTKIDAGDFPYLEGYHFPDDIAKQIPRAVRDWTITPWGPSSKYGQFLDRVQSMWKSGVTIYRPGHHIRNMVGDTYLGWMDGVNTVRPYILAARVQRAIGGYDDIADVDRLIEVGLMKKEFGTPKPGEVIFRNKSGVPFTAEQIKYVADQKGLLEHAKTLEDIIDLGEGGAKLLNVKPFGGRVQKIARGASELQSHNARLAHFIDKVMKSKGNNLEEIFESASRRARKFHPTGLDLTFEERKYARRLIPFYSWMRKSAPLLLNSMIMKPGKTVIPSKIYGAIQEAQGIETGGREDPFPVDQLFPDWIKDQGVGPISTDEGFLSAFSNQTIPGYVMGGVGLNPLADLVSQIDDPGRTIGSSLTPYAKIPIENMTGREMFTGAPISGPQAQPGAYGEYVGKNIPIVSVAQGLTGVTPFGGETKATQKDRHSGMEAFINFMTGLGVKGTGKYIPSARFEEQLKQRMARREYWADKDGG